MMANRLGTSLLKGPTMASKTLDPWLVEEPSKGEEEEDEDEDRGGGEWSLEAQVQLVSR